MAMQLGLLDLMLKSKEQLELMWIWTQAVRWRKSWMLVISSSSQLALNLPQPNPQTEESSLSVVSLDRTQQEEALGLMIVKRVRRCLSLITRDKAWTLTLRRKHKDHTLSLMMTKACIRWLYLSLTIQVFKYRILSHRCQIRVLLVINKSLQLKPLTILRWLLISWRSSAKSTLRDISSLSC